MRATKLDAEISKLSYLLTENIASTDFDGVVLSGGIDSSLLAYFASKVKNGKSPVTAVTMYLQGTAARDPYYSSIVANTLGMRHVLIHYSMEEAETVAREIVKTLRTFDHVEIRNDITVYLALKRCREEGLRGVLTGDGGDELFAGYDYMISMKQEELKEYITALPAKWRFSATQLGESIGLQVIQPYISRTVLDYAIKLPVGMKVHDSDGKVWGKWILREMLDRSPLKQIAWRPKEPIEVGSGSHVLTKRLLDSIGIEEAAGIQDQALKEGVKLWSPEQAYFYRLYRELVGRVPRPSEGGFACGSCGGPLKSAGAACQTCGYVRGGN